MIQINFTWKILTNDGRLQDLPDLAKEDKNWFSTRETAIQWLTEKKNADEDFADPYCLILTEMFFTR